MVKNKQEKKKLSTFKIKWKNLCFLSLEFPVVEDIKKRVLFSEKAVRKTIL